MRKGPRKKLTKDTKITLNIFLIVVTSTMLLSTIFFAIRGVTINNYFTYLFIVLFLLTASVPLSLIVGDEIIKKIEERLWK